MLKFVKDNFSWVKDVAIVGFLILVMWANSHYVTVGKFESYIKSNESRMELIQQTIASLDKSLALLQQNNVILVGVQADVLRINVVLNDVVQQNKMDAAVNDEVHKYIPHIIQMESSLAQLQKEFEVVKLNGSSITRERLALLETEIKRATEEIALLKKVPKL